MKKEEMNILSINVNDFHFDYIYFLEPKINLIISGLFIKIIYTAPFYTLNSIYLNIPIDNRDSIFLLKKIELYILEKYVEITKKKKSFVLSVTTSIFHRIQNGKSCALKISGIWESEKEIGLIYKWLELSPISLLSST